MVCDELSEEEKNDALANLLSCLLYFVQENILVHLVEILKNEFLVSLLGLLDALGPQMGDDLLVLNVKLFLGRLQD